MNTASMGGLITSALSGSYAGAFVLDAVREDRFWVFPDAVPHLEAFAADVAEVPESGS